MHANIQLCVMGVLAVPGHCTQVMDRQLQTMSAGCHHDPTSPQPALRLQLADVHIRCHIPPFPPDMPFSGTLPPVPGLAYLGRCRRPAPWLAEPARLDGIVPETKGKTSDDKIPYLSPSYTR